MLQQVAPQFQQPHSIIIIIIIIIIISILTWPKYVNYCKHHRCTDSSDEW